MLTFAGVPDRSDDYSTAAARLPVVPAVVAGVVVAVVVALVSWWWLGLLAGLVVGFAVWYLRPRNSLTRVLSRYDAVELDPDEHPRLDNLVESLCYSAGADEPTVYVLADSAMNLAAVADRDAGALIVTEGLIDGLDRVELEGVLAAGLVRLRCGDAHLSTRAATLLTGPLLDNGPSRVGPRAGLVALLASWRAARVRSLFAEHRAIETDLSAAAITRYPPALFSALTKMRERGTAVETATWGTSHLWLANPLTEGTDERTSALNSLFDLHGRLDHRIDVLAEL